MRARLIMWRTRAALRLRDQGFLLHVLVAWVPLWWGLILALPADTFASSIAFDVMEEIGPERVWSGGMMAAGALGMWSAFDKSRPHARFVAVGLLAFVHGLIAICLWQASPIGTGTGVYAGLALASALMLLERAREIA